MFICLYFISKDNNNNTIQIHQDNLEYLSCVLLRVCTVCKSKNLLTN